MDVDDLETGYKKATGLPTINEFPVAFEVKYGSRPVEVTDVFFKMV